MSLRGVAFRARSLRSAQGKRGRHGLHERLSVRGSDDPSEIASHTGAAINRDAKSTFGAKLAQLCGLALLSFAAGCAYTATGRSRCTTRSTRRACRRATRSSCAVPTAAGHSRRSGSPPPTSPRSRSSCRTRHGDPGGRTRGHQASVAWMGRRADAAVGTAGDRPGDDFWATATPGRWTASTWRPICRAICWLWKGTSCCVTTASGRSTSKRTSARACTAGPTTPAS